MNIDTLKVDLAPKEARLKELNEKLEAGGHLSDTEMPELRTLVDDVKRISGDIEYMQESRNLLKDKAHAAAKKGSPERQFAERATIHGAAKALMASKGHAPKDGLYAELHEAGMKEAAERGVVEQITGIAIPSWMAERTTLDAATAATAANTIATNLYPFVPAPRPSSILEVLGCTFWNGLTGNVEVPAGDGLVTATYNTENGDADEGNPTTKKISLTPKRMAVWAKSTKQLMAQSSISVADWLSNEIISGEMRKLASVALQGGSTNEPTGLLSMATTAGNINLVEIDTDGGEITRAKLLEMEQLLDVANTADGMLKFLTTPAVKAYLKNLISSAGVGPYVWTDSNTLIGYDAYRTNLLPTNLTKGASGAVCHPIIFGDWSRLIIGNWGVRDLTVDDFTRAKQAEVQIILNVFNDVQCVHKQGFSVIKDVTVA